MANHTALFSKNFRPKIKRLNAVLKMGIGITIFITIKAVDSSA